VFLSLTPSQPDPKDVQKPESLVLSKVITLVVINAAICEEYECSSAALWQNAPHVLAGCLYSQGYVGPSIHAYLHLVHGVMPQLTSREQLIFNACDNVWCARVMSSLNYHVSHCLSKALILEFSQRCLDVDTIAELHKPNLHKKWILRNGEPRFAY